MNLFDHKISPTQRALVQMTISVLIGSIIAGLSAASDYLARNTEIDTQRLALIVGLSVAFSCGHALVVFLMAHNADMALALDAVLQQVEKRFSAIVPPAFIQSTLQPVVLATNAPTTQPQAQQGAVVAINTQEGQLPATQTAQNSTTASTAPTQVVASIPQRPALSSVNLVPMESPPSAPIPGVQGTAQQGDTVPRAAVITRM